jgi:hypothetical protein
LFYRDGFARFFVIPGTENVTASRKHGKKRASGYFSSALVYEAAGKNALWRKEK